MPNSRMGELLKARGVLTDAQIQQILERQKVVQHPFGAVAADMFHVQEAELWRAWAQQMVDCCPTADVANMLIPEKALSFVTAREAWAYRLLPLDWSETELTVATTAECLPNAMSYAQIKSPVPVSFCIAPAEELESAIKRYFHVGEMAKAA